MAGTSSIGSLTLDISDVEKKISQINQFLGQIGAGINIEDKLSKGISAALNKIINEAKEAGAEAQKALEKAVPTTGGSSSGGGIESTMNRLTSTVNTYTAGLDAAGQATAQLTGSVMTGFDAAGNKIKEFANSTGEITRRTEEIKNSVEEQIEAMWKLHDAEEQAYQKQGDAAVEAGLKREATAQRAAQAEEDRMNKEVAQMEESLERRQAMEDAALEKRIAADEAAQEKKRQKEIEAEFEREEARKKAAQAEEEQMAKEIAMMEESIQKKQELAQQQFETDQVQRAKQAYFELTDAIKNYNIAKQTDDDAGMQAAQARIDAAMQEVSAMREVVENAQLEAAAKQQVENSIQQCVTAEKQHAAEIGKTVASTNEIESQITGVMTRMFSLMAVIRTLNNLIQSTVEYVSEYSQKMNEIQMITLKSGDEVEKLGDRYRQIAEDMSVSSLDMADAAIYFTRQGLKTEQIEDRLKNVTQYAKAANIEFRDASEIMTAVVNSMKLVDQEATDGRSAMQRVADVFLKVGDNAATSGQEIGEAMQKAAASAGAFGVSFEWLTSAIATVSETTRQEARTIGTAFNTIIARLHQIKQSGYNSEDETKINDVAKALSKIDVALMNQNNEWRDMEDVWNDVAAKWGDLDGKTKSYIATTMAGVKQQNVFLAAMNDMSKTIEEGGRFWELYGLAMDSAGTAGEKYAVWTDSVAASQERLNIAQEKFYSLLDDSVIKSWNNMWANLVTNIADAAEMTSGLNLILPVAIGLFTAFSVAITKAGTASAIFANIWKSHPYLVAIAAGAAVVAGLVAMASNIISSIETAEEKVAKATKSLEENKARYQELTGVQNELNGAMDEISGSADGASGSLESYTDLVAKISNISPAAKQAIDDMSAGLMSEAEAAAKVTEEIEKQIEANKKLALSSVVKEFNNMTPEKISGAEKDTEWARIYRDPTGIEREMESFTALLRQKYIDWAAQNFLDMPFEVLTAMQDIIEEYSFDDSYGSDDWETIANMIWDKYRLGDSDDVAKRMTKTVEDAVEKSISQIGMYFDNFEQGMLRDMLLSAIFGEDGQLSEEEYNKYTDVIGQFFQNIYNRVANNEDIFSSVSAANQIFKNVFGDFFGDFIPEEFSELINNEESAKIIADAYSSLLEQGFSEIEINDLLASLDASQWKNMVMMMQRKLFNEISDISNEALHDVTSTDEYGREEIDMLMWTQLDNSTLNLIKHFVEAGTELSTIKQLMRDADGDVDQFKESLNQLGNEDALENTEDTIEQAIKSFDDLEKNITKLDKALATLSKGENISTEDLTELINLYPEIIHSLDSAETLAKKLEEVKTKTQEQQRQAIKDALLDSEGIMKNSEYAISGFSTLREYINAFNEIGQDTGAEEYVDRLIERMYELTGETEEATEAAKTWLQTQREQNELKAEQEWAKTNGYYSQLDNIHRGLTGGHIEGFEHEDISAAYQRWNNLDEAMRNSISSTYPDVISALEEVEAALQSTEDREEKARKAYEKLDKALGRAKKFAIETSFKNTTDAMLKLEKGTISAKDAFDAFEKDLQKFQKAEDEVAEAQEKLDKGTKLTTSDVENLANVLGVTAQTVVDDFPGAVEMFDTLRQYGQELFNDFNKQVTMKILGVGEAEFDDLMAGIVGVENEASAAVKMLLGLGQFKIEEREVEEGITFPMMSEDGSIVMHTAEATGTYKVLVPTNNNPFGEGLQTDKKSGGGGGGGGGKKKDPATEKQEKAYKQFDEWLEKLEKARKISQYMSDYWAAIAEYYKSLGLYKGSIEAIGHQIESIEKENRTLDKNITKIEKKIKQKEKELKQYKKGSEEYKKCKEQIEELNDKMEEYTVTIIENKTTIIGLQEAIKDLREETRDMQIDVANEIYKAIEDRERKTSDMLNAEIELENKVLDIIRKRYEEERDNIIEVTNMKIDALREERDLLDEQLRIRKEQAEQENKVQKLQELELQYQRIAADPTRAKEADKIRKQIADLREEMAWDAAEQEVKAQQESIDQQIESLEDYIEYVENYYEELFEHPDKLIEEMKKVMTMSENQILAWLKANDEEYATSTENRKKQMTQAWQETLDERAGRIRTYWAEVDSIIKKGDTAIINFLKANSDEYAKAGKLAAEKYVAEWKEKLQDIKNALKDVTNLEKEATSTKNTSGGSSSSSTSSSSSSSGSKWIIPGISGMEFNSEGEARSWITNETHALENMIDSARRAGSPKGSTSSMEARLAQLRSYAPVRKYISGGIADFTGPAWLDGTKSDPERILSPHQTRLFETMIESLERMSRITIPTMPDFSGLDITGGGVTSVGDIIVNVDNLDTDDDYETLAEKVSDVLMERIGRTTVVGGLRVNTY